MAKPTSRRGSRVSSSQEEPHSQNGPCFEKLLPAADILGALAVEVRSGKVLVCIVAIADQTILKGTDSFCCTLGV